MTTRSAVGAPDVPIDLIADDEPGLVLAGVDLEAGRRLDESDEPQVVEVGRRRPSPPARRRPLCVARRIAASGPPGPRPWASSLPSTEISVSSGPESQRQAVPARRASQALDLQPARRLDGQALLGPAQDDPDRGPARPGRGRRPRRCTPCRRTRPRHRGRPARAGRPPAAPPGCGPTTAPSAGSRRLRPSPSRGSSADSGLPVIDHRDRSIVSKRSASTRASPGRWTIACTQRRGSVISPRCQPGAQRTSDRVSAAERPRKPRGLANQQMEGRRDGRRRRRTGPQRCPALAPRRGSSFPAPVRWTRRRPPARIGIPNRASPAIRPGIFRPSGRSSSSPSARACATHRQWHDRPHRHGEADGRPVDRPGSHRSIHGNRFYAA